MLFMPIGWEGTWGNEDFIRPERLGSQFTTYPSTPCTTPLLLLCLILCVEKDGEN